MAKTDVPEDLELRLLNAIHAVIGESVEFEGPDEEVTAIKAEVSSDILHAVLSILGRHYQA